MFQKITRSVAILAAVTGISIAGFHSQQNGKEGVVPASGGDGSALFSTSANDFVSTGKSLPAVMPQRDRELYRAIFSAQKKADWKAADAFISGLSNPILMGHVLAERYLHHKYSAQPAELADWLGLYHDLPQASEIYTLAVTRQPALKSVLISPRRQRLQGYGDDNGLASRDNPDFNRSWRKALSTWRSGNKHEAALLFSGIANKSEALSPWQASAASYWAWRSYDAIGNKNEAQRHLIAAAKEPRSFYGILARKKLKQPLDLDAKPVTLSESDILEMVGESPVRRIIALSHCGLTDLAEKELRTAFLQAEHKDKQRLLALAYELNLASVQISMGKHLSRNGRLYDFARYPIPHWEPRGGFKVDPALVYALMRQESGFHANAVSSGGALGLMQLMPKTASLMQKRMDSPIESVTDPMHNIELGQGYIEHLLENNMVEGNLFYMLAAYNAGPGRLQDWKRSIDYNNDPLLFVESIPFAQTRFYVMQVMTNYWIYSELAGTPSRSVSVLLGGNWPNYDGASTAAKLAANTAG